MSRFGVDSLDDARTILPEVTTQAGRKPDFWIRYLHGPGPVTASEIAALRQDGIAVGLISGTATASRVQGTYADGYADAHADVAAAQALGAPANVRLMLDLEAGWSPSAHYLLGWCEAQVAGPFAGAGCLYCDPYSPGTQNAIAALLAVWRYPQNEPVLWSAEPEPGAGGIPAWGPATCYGLSVVLWQYAESAFGGIVDLDLAADGYTGLWEAVPVGEFSDVPSTAWYASDVATAAKDGLMEGVGNGMFAPDAALTRAEGAALAVRIMAKVGSPTVSTVAQSADSRARGALRSRPRAGLADHRAWTATAQPIPAEYTDPIMAALPVENQQQTGMCVAFASTEIRRWWLKKLGQADVELSAPYVYARGHADEGGGIAEGMEPVQALAALKQYGVCPWAQDPLNPSTETVAQSEAASPASLDTAAAQYRVSAYGPVDVGDTAAMQAAIMHAPILIAIPVPMALGIESPVSDGRGGWNVLWPTGPNVQTIAGHAIVLYGWKTDATGHLWWLLRNSWGASWASGGSAWLDSSYPIWEAWSLSCAAQSPICQQLADFLAWMEADAQTIIQRLEHNFAAADAATAAARAQAAYDGQIAALKASMAQKGC